MKIRTVFSGHGSFWWNIKFVIRKPIYIFPKNHNIGKFRILFWYFDKYKGG